VRKHSHLQVKLNCESQNQTFLLRQAQEALRQSEERYRQLVESSFDAILVHRDGTITFVNSAGVKLFGANKPEELVGKPFLELIHLDSREAAGKQIKHTCETGQTIPALEEKLLTLNGAMFYAEVVIGVIIEQGRKSHLVVVRDIAARKVAEAAQRESQARKSAMLEFALDAIVTIDHEGKIFEWNPAAEKMFGYRRAAVLGKELAQLIIPPASRDRHRPGLGHFLAAGKGSVLGKRTEMTALRADGNEFPVELSIARIAHEGPPIFIGFIRDITQHRQIEEQLRQLQKMESIGQLAAGVAHDFNNILAVIQGHMDMVLSGMVEGNDAVESLKQVAGAARRAADLTRQLLAFSRKQPMQLQDLNLNEVVSGMTKMLGRLLGADVALQFVPAPNLPAVNGDVGMIEQVLLNLAVNARDAMPLGGHLVITTAIRTTGDTQVERNPEARSGQFVRLSVSDTGCGIAPEILPRIFEPFFTTKEIGKGTGLGLATVYGIVKQHQGWIEVESEAARGFNVYLPAGSKAAAPPAEASPSAAVRGHGETILIAEDEPTLRRLASRVLRNLGYEVLEAGSGVEALEVWEQQGKKVDLLLTDLIMPDGLTGRELAKKLEQRESGLKVIYTSGYTPETTETVFVFREGVNFLQKPYHPQVLAKAVRDCLDA